MAADTPKTTPVPHDDPFRIDPRDKLDSDTVWRERSPEEMAHRLRPLRTMTKGPGWDATDVAYRGGVKGETTQITYSRVTEGLNKLIARLHEVRGMSDVVRETLTRDVPKDELEVEGKVPMQDNGPLFEHLAQLTIQLSREIERIEKNMALALAVLK